MIVSQARLCFRNLFALEHNSSIISKLFFLFLENKLSIFSSFMWIGRPSWFLSSIYAVAVISFCTFIDRLEAANHIQYTWIQTYRCVNWFCLFYAIYLAHFQWIFKNCKFPMISSCENITFAGRKTISIWFFEYFFALFNNFTYLIGHVAKVKELYSKRRM